MFPAGEHPEEGYLVLYDGACGLCQRSVRWLLDHDPYQRLFFAPLQGTTAARLRSQRVPVPENLESVALVVLYPSKTQVFLRARAFLQLCEIVEYRPWWVRLLRHVPVALLDLGYRLTARLRYLLFGQATTCPWHTEAESKRFLP